jgi:uncharacterized protein DUF3168
MPAFNVFPDAEAVVGKAIRDASISGLGNRVYSSIPNNPTWPLVLVRRIGGVPAVRQYLDTANVQIEVWGDTKANAQSIAQQARTAVLNLEGRTLTDPVNAFVTGVDDSLGLFWMPDQETSRDRYIFGMLIWLHA